MYKIAFITCIEKTFNKLFISFFLQKYILWCINPHHYQLLFCSLCVSVCVCVPTKRYDLTCSLFLLSNVISFYQFDKCLLMCGACDTIPNFMLLCILWNNNVWRIKWFLFRIFSLLLFAEWRNISTYVITNWTIEQVNAENTINSFEPWILLSSPMNTHHNDFMFQFCISFLCVH